MPKVSFDGDNRIISILPGETSVSVKSDIYSEWKRWVIDNAQYPVAIRVTGGDPIGGGLFTGDIYFLLNGWQISVPDNNVNIDGVIYHDDAIPVFVVDPGGSVISTVSSLVQTVSTAGGSSGSSLTKQDVRDAMSLSTSVQTSTGSIDGKLDNIRTVTEGTAIVVNDIQNRITNLSLSLTQTTALVELLLKFEQNRTRVDRANNTLTVYDDNGTTPLHVFNLLDEGGQPSTDDIVERVPQ